MAPSQSEVAASAEAPDTWQSYRHLTGLTFSHPADWQVQASQTGGLQLRPADLLTSGGVADEVFTLVGQPAQGVRSADDPRVQPHVTRLVMQTFPYLRPATGAVGAGLQFAGTYADTAYRALAQYRILADTLILVLSVSPERRFDERQAVMQRVFASLRMGSLEEAEGDASRDPALYGTWLHHQIYHSVDMTGTVVRKLVLAADGSCRESGQMAAGLDNEVGSVGMESQGGDVALGRWQTKGQQLILNWSDGSTTLVRYVKRGGSMLWMAGGQRKLWELSGPAPASIGAQQRW